MIINNIYMYVCVYECVIYVYDIYIIIINNYYY